MNSSQSEPSFSKIDTRKGLPSFMQLSFHVGEKSGSPSNCLSSLMVAAQVSDA
jgi:hypothetical protein